MTPSQAKALARVQAELARLVRYDHESVVHDAGDCRDVARALLIHPRHLPYEVLAAVAGGA